MPQSPASRGFRFPAEWEVHEATWLSWPTNRATWPELDAMLPDYAAFVREIARGETVHINLPAGAARDHAISLLQNAGADLHKIVWHEIPTNDAWCRDHGPLVLVHQDGRRLILDFEYNAWGGKYPPFDNDDRVPAQVGAFLKIPVESQGIVMEGGSLDFNGQGVLLTTSHCLLNPNRNPHLNQTQIAEHLSKAFDLQEILWLGDGIVGDDTDGHVDDITRFVGPQTIVTVVESNPEDANFAPLQENLEALKAWNAKHNNAYTIVELPMPAPLYVDGERLPASYGNFYICNAAVIVPTFADPMDEVALNLLRTVIIDRPVIGLDSRRIVWGLGSFHCLSQQIPASQHR
jgi:agmatine deiminase